MPLVHITGRGSYNFPDSLDHDQIVRIIDANIMPPSWKAGPDIASATALEKPPVMARVGRGAVDVTDRIAQLAIGAGEKMGLQGYPPGLSDIATKQMNAEREQYAKAQGPGFDVARMAGSTAIQAPLALLPGGQSALARSGSGAISGAVSGLLQYDPTNSMRNGLQNTVMGAGVGAVAAPVVGAVVDKMTPVVAAIYGRIKGLISKVAGDANPSVIINQIPEFSNLAPDAKNSLIAEAQQQIKQTGTLDAEALARKANLVANGVTPTKSMVTRNPADWTKERNLQKLAQAPDEQLASVGQDLTNVYQGNDQALSNRLTGMRDQYPAGSQESQGLTVMQKLEELSKASQKTVGEIYDQVKQTSGDQLASDAHSLVDKLNELQDSTYSEKLVSSVRNKLKRFGMLDADGALTNNTLTVSQAEELRKFVNTLPNDFGKRDIISAIDADVLAGAGADAFAGARGAAAQRFNMLDNATTQKALGALGELSQGKTAQNFIKSQVIDGSAGDVAELVTTLSKLPNAQSKEAMGALSAGVLEHLQNKSINANSGQFSATGLNSAIKDIGDAKLLAVLGKSELDKLKSLARAGLDATYAPPFSAVNNSNTAPLLLSLTQRARAIPGVPLFVSEEAQKIAAQSGYRGQLGNVLSAKSTPQLSAPRTVQEMMATLAAMAPQTANAALYQRRNQSNGSN
jgi:hypothetical protein